jgi:hypothetical protein
VAKLLHSAKERETKQFGTLLHDDLKLFNKNHTATTTGVQYITSLKLQINNATLMSHFSHFS